jgi:hypothetical protein
LAVLHGATVRLSAQLSASIEKVFRCLDADGNGFLDRDELKAGFASMVCSRPYTPNHDIVYVHGVNVLVISKALPRLVPSAGALLLTVAAGLTYFRASSWARLTLMS